VCQLPGGGYPPYAAARGTRGAGTITLIVARETRGGRHVTHGTLRLARTRYAAVGGLFAIATENASCRIPARVGQSGNVGIDHPHIGAEPHE